MVVSVAGSFRSRHARVGGNGTGVGEFARAANGSEKAQRGKFVSDGEKRNETERNYLINEQTYYQLRD